MTSHIYGRNTIAILQVKIVTVRISGKDLSRYSNKIESVGLRKCPCLRYLTKKVMSK